MAFLTKIAGESINIAGVLSCGHKFCYHCIESWAKVCNTCPLCKKEFKEIKKFQKCGQYIDYKVIANTSIEEEIEGKRSDIEFDNGVEDECYRCGNGDDLERMLICDHCDKNCCHIYCLDPPIDYIPSDNWYCRDCCFEFKLKNNYKRPIGKSMMIESGGKGNIIKIKKRGRKPGKSQNPLKDSHKEIEEIKKLRTDRKSRAERRRMIELGERGSLARRRRFRIRQSKKKKRGQPRSKSEVKVEVRRSKRKKIGKVMENIKKGVFETLNRKIRINERVRIAKQDNAR